MKQFFDQPVRVTDRQIGPYIPAHQRDEWPEAELYGVTFDNTIEWAWDGNQAFARWFEEDDTMELLVVVTSVDPFINFTEVLDRVGETLPENMDVEVSEPEPGSPVIVALTFAVAEAARCARFSSMNRSASGFSSRANVWPGRLPFSRQRTRQPIWVPAQLRTGSRLTSAIAGRRSDNDDSVAGGVHPCVETPQHAAAVVMLRYSVGVVPVLVMAPPTMTDRFVLTLSARRCGISVRAGWMLVFMARNTITVAPAMTLPARRWIRSLPGGSTLDAAVPGTIDCGTLR